MTSIMQDNASFRDPAGHVYLTEHSVYRSVQPQALTDFTFTRQSGFIATLINDGLLWPEEILPEHEWPTLPNATALVLQHPQLPFISYPYEWTFSALKQAALLHLDIHLKALNHGITLNDASAYNIQFIGTKPVFIDHLSFRRYQEGELWQGHQQFCQQFLNPLLLQAKLGIPYHAWYRGNLLGISAQELRALLPLKTKLTPRILMHVILQASLQKTSNQEAALTAGNIALPLTGLQKLLSNLQQWISELKPKHSLTSVWNDYTQTNSYSLSEQQHKAAAVAEFCETIKPKMLWDLGCNSGDYAKVALKHGTEFVVGFDNDPLVLDSGFQRAETDKLTFLPLCIDLCNPSPNQGVFENERKGFQQRAKADGILALALVHHLTLTHNIPLAKLCDWLTSLAPQGLVEFVAKSDPKVKELLALRKDIFPDYTLENFLNYVSKKADIVKVLPLDDHRSLIWFRKKS